MVEQFLRPNRRNFFRLAAIATGAGVLAAVGAAAAAERSLQALGEDKIYRVGSDDVQVSSKEFIPEYGQISDPSEAAVFLVGAPMRAKASVTWGTIRQVANRFKVRSFSIDARPKGPFTANSIDLEVEGIRRFIEENGIKKLTVIAHSIGAVKAAKLAVVLQQLNPDIQINGLALANPMGFYNQNPWDLLLNRYPAEITNGPKLSNPNSSREDKNMFKVMAQLVGSIAADVSAVGLSYPKLAREQLQALTQVNPNLAEVKAPVVILVAKEDKLAEVEGIFPEQEILSIARSKWAAKLAGNSRQQMAAVGCARREYARAQFFPNASNIEVILASRFANHLAFGQRTEETVHVVGGIFKRLRRANTSVKAA